MAEHYTPGTLAANEFLVIQEIAKIPTHTQRSLSRSVGLSLGATNLIIKRLARKGYIKVAHLDWKRTQYLLTLTGAAEKARKAYHYTLYTMRIFRQIQENITTVLRREYLEGRRDFVLVAEDEVLELLQETIRAMGLDGASFSYHRSFAQVPPDTGLVLTATLQPPPTDWVGGCRFVNLVDFNDIHFRVV